MLSTTAAPRKSQGTRYDWSTVDLERHVRAAGQAGGLLDTIRGSLWDFDEILREFASVAESAGSELRFTRDDDALVWSLSLSGPTVRASGSVAIALETPTCATILARPEGHEPLQWQVVTWEGRRGRSELAEQLKNDFRAAAAAAVLDATGVISS